MHPGGARRPSDPSGTDFSLGPAPSRCAAPGQCRCIQAHAELRRLAKAPSAERCRGRGPGHWDAPSVEPHGATRSLTHSQRLTHLADKAKPGTTEVVAGLDCPSWARTRTLLIQRSSRPGRHFGQPVGKQPLSERQCPDSCRSLPARARRNYGKTTAVEPRGWTDWACTPKRSTTDLCPRTLQPSFRRRGV
jgi:hypothetical protein